MTDYIGYEGLTQAAMRGVMRETLRKVSASGGLPGGHHFYISFRTRAPGVKIADHLIERFPEDMTIVVQHQYWDLEVHDDHFEIILKFSGVPQHLHVPFSAVTRFVDPSVKFGLSFERDEANSEDLVDPVDADPVETPAADSDGATVVSLEAFRKK